LFLADVGPPGGWVTLGSVFITTVGTVVVALVKVYRRAGDIQGKVDGQIADLIAKLEAEHAAKEALAVQLAVLQERMKHPDGG
jgi:hypothetical protein